MNNKMWFRHVFLAILSLVLVSCKQQPEMEAKPTSPINSLAIAINDQLWTGEIGDSLRKKFAAPVDGLPQEEPLFTIQQFPIKLFDTHKNQNTNLILIKKEEKSRYKLVKNKYLKPQNLVVISGNSIPEILNYIEQNGDSLIRIFKETEIKRNQDLINENLLSDEKIRKKFKVSLNVPNTFQYVLEKPNFIWMKKEILSGNTSIIIYKVPFKALLKDNNIVTNITRMRDVVGSKYIKGKDNNSYMITEESYAPYFDITVIDKKRTYETKGTWELKGDYMSGSFINYAILNRKKREFIVIEGFCYAPSTSKRDLMMELEAIIKSVQFL
ncbi:DUF4837 family protein [Flavobacterium sp.]|uniref:DUF4837 family protein n=1 Tax=Flavobacterium sp. TaxID=239 RepID=UPI002636FB43|nr:DUF4837 family protein [Flavobacterium sp.]MDD3004300.1 DUF4837 family protein [Flavobacterium sp.]